MQKHSFCIASIANRDHPLEIMNSIANHDRQPPPTSPGPHSPNHQRLIYRWLSGELQMQKPPPTMRIRLSEKTQDLMKTCLSCPMNPNRELLVAPCS